MSSDAMIEMLNKAMRDAEFATGLVAAVGDKSGDEAVSVVVSFGTGHGFPVTTDDAVAMRKQLLAMAEDSNGDLQDSDLESMSGGVGLSNLASLMGGGGALGRMAGGGFGGDPISGGINSAVGSATGAANRTIDAGVGMANSATKTGASAVNSFVKQW